MVKGYGKSGHYPTGNLVTGGTGKVVRGYGKSGHPIDLQWLIYNGNDLQRNGLQQRSRCAASPGVTFFGFLDWEKARQDFAKFQGICRKPADRAYLFKVLALTQATIPPWAAWDALEAVRQIRPAVPIAYFRTVLADNCRKADVDLQAALRRVRVPKGSAKLRKLFPVPATIGRTIPEDPPLPSPESILEQLAVIHHAERKGPR